MDYYFTWARVFVRLVELCKSAAFSFFLSFFFSFFLFFSVIVISYLGP